jgi:cytidyltransferase-like protein
MTADIITPGHIRFIKKCHHYGDVVIGLLTDHAVKGYKKIIMTYLERCEVLDAVKWVKSIVPQNGLYCYTNLMKCQANYLASGDGFDPKEIEAAKNAGCKLLNIKLAGEKNGKKWSSTNIKKRILCQKDFS